MVDSPVAVFFLRIFNCAPKDRNYTQMADAGFNLLDSGCCSEKQLEAAVRLAPAFRVTPQSNTHPAGPRIRKNSLQPWPA